MAKCAVVGCDSIYNPFHSDITFHRITRNKKYLPLWEQVVKFRTDLTNAKICSLHFRAQDFIKGREKRVLKLSAVPSVNVIDKESYTDDEDDNENLSTLKEFLTASNSRSVKNGRETADHEDVCDSKMSQKFEIVSCCNTAQSTDPQNAKQTNNIGVQTNIKSDKEISLQAKVKLLQLRLRRRDAKISYMKTVLNMIKKHIKGTDMEYKLCCELQNISEFSEPVKIVKDRRKKIPNRDTIERAGSPISENEEVESSGDEAGMFVEVVHSANLKVSNGF